MAEKKRNARPFWPRLLGLALALTLAGGAALAWMWRALERYEAATPEASILSCIRAVQAGGEAPEPPYELLPGRFGSEKDYWAAAEKQLAALPASRDELRFFRTAQGEAVRYTVTAQEGQKAEFLLYPQQGGWRAWPIVPALPDYSFTAPATARLWVNGVPLSYAEKVGGAAAPGFEALGETAPQVYTYQVSGLLAPPELTAESDEGECLVEWSGERAAHVEVRLAGEAADELAAFLERAARVYAAFVSSDAAFSELSPLLVKDTAFYHDLRTFDSHWYVSHDSVEFEEMQVLELASAGGEAASGTVSFTYVVKKEGLKPRSYPSCYRMCAVRRDGAWRLLALQVK